MRSKQERLGVVAFAALAVGLAGCSSSEGAPPADGDEDANIRIVNVEVTRMEPTSFTDYIRVTGEVEAMYDIVLSAEESGAVKAFMVAKGRVVRAGQVIAELDAAVLTAQVAEARATAGLARDEYERRRQLWEEEQIGSEIAYLQARAAAEAAEARLATLEARLQRTKIRAPVSGVFDEKLIELGEMAMPGTPVARIVSVRQVKITGGVPERHAVAVERGDTARITLDVLPGEVFDGRITYVGTSVDATNRTVPIEVVMNNPNGAAKPRMIANLLLVRDALDDVFVAPQQVVQRTENGYEVFVVAQRDGRDVAESRLVELGPAYENRVVIASGLSTGDQLITLGQQLVDAGTRVRIVNETGPSVDARKDSE